MPIAVTCPKCGAKLSAPDTAAGKRVKCPKFGCATAIAVPAPAMEFEVVEDEPARPVKKKAAVELDDEEAPKKPKKKAVVELDDEDEAPQKPRKTRADDKDEDDKPKKKKKARAEVEDEDEREEDEDEKPRKKRSVRAEDEEDEEEDEDDKPRKKKKKNQKGGGLSPVLIAGIAVVALLVLGGAGYGIYALTKKKPEQTAGTNTEPAAQPDETYTIKLYKTKKGDKTTHESDKSSKATFVTTGRGQVKKDEKTGSEKEVYTEEILEMNTSDGRPTKFTRTYSISEKTAEGETKKASYVGETVLFEKKGDKYELTVKGKPLNESDASELVSALKDKKDKNDKKDGDFQEEDILPPGPIKVGASWQPPPEKVEKMSQEFGEGNMKIDAKKSTFVGKLLRAYKKDGAQYGTIEFTMTIVVTELDYGKGNVGKATPDSKIVMTITTDVCLDGTTPAEETKMVMTMDINTEIPNVLTQTVKVTSTDTRKVRAAK